MEIKAEAKYVRSTPRKMRLVVDAIRGLTPQQALDELVLIDKRAAKPLGVVIKSAVANAVNNHSLKEEELQIKQIQVNEGPSFKRWHAGPRGMARPYVKRTSHIKIILTIKSEIRNPKS